MKAAGNYAADLKSQVSAKSEGWSNIFSKKIVPKTSKSHQNRNRFFNNQICNCTKLKKSKLGYPISLYLDSTEQRYVQEWNTSNFVQENFRKYSEMRKRNHRIKINKFHWKIIKFFFSITKFALIGCRNSRRQIFDSPAWTCDTRSWFDFSKVNATNLQIAWKFCFLESRSKFRFWCNFSSK